MQLPALSTDIIIIAMLLAALAYGVVAGKQRLRILILSVYVGIVLAEQFTSLATPKVPQVGAGPLSWVLFGLPIVFFGLVGMAHAKDHARGSVIANAIVGALTGALIISSALRLLPTSEMSAIDNGSFLATNLGQFHVWILGALPVVALLFGFMKREKKTHH